MSGQRVGALRQIHRNLVTRFRGPVALDHILASVEAWSLNPILSVYGQRSSRTYLRFSPIPRLHLGCGGNFLEGWLNVDFFPQAPGVVVMDLRKPLPLPSNTFDTIFHEHLIEHLTDDQGLSLTRECWRVLRPGGVLRINTPDLQALRRLMERPLTTKARVYVDWMGQTFLSELPNVLPSDAVNLMFYGHGHRIIYDVESLARLLRKAGFSRVTQCQVGQSGVPAFEGIEGHGRAASPAVNEFETMAVEATKGSE